MAQQKATTPDAVIEAAAEVFREKGYRSATLDDIAQRAGISKPTVYRYAKSKQWIMDRIVLRIQAELDERAAAVWEPGIGAAEQLRRLIQVNIETAVEFRPLYEVAFSQHQESTPRTAKQYRQWAREVTTKTAAVLQNASSQGALSLSGDPMVHAQLLHGMLASTHRWFHPNAPLSSEQLTDHVLELLGIGAASK